MVKAGYEIAYLAGFFDGEGCVQIVAPHRTSLFLLQLSVNNTRREVLSIFRKRWGGSIVGPHNRGLNHKPAFTWKVDARHAEKVLRDLFPFLILKRRQAEVGLKFRELFQSDNILPRGNADPKKFYKKRFRIMKKRERMYHHMRKLNLRGTGEYVKKDMI